jgi:hypothetical protein
MDFEFSGDAATDDCAWKATMTRRVIAGTCAPMGGARWRLAENGESILP